MMQEVYKQAVYLQIPSPEDLSDSELHELLNSEDPSGYKMPMSLGESRSDFDKCK